MAIQRREPPLSDHELRIVRGMIDEYSYDEARSRFLRSTWRSGRAVIVGVAAVLVFVMQLATVIIAARGGR